MSAADHVLAIIFEGVASANILTYGLEILANPRISGAVLDGVVLESSEISLFVLDDETHAKATVDEAVFHAEATIGQMHYTFPFAFTAATAQELDILKLVVVTLAVDFDIMPRAVAAVVGRTLQDDGLVLGTDHF